MEVTRGKRGKEKPDSPLAGSRDAFGFALLFLAALVAYLPALTGRQLWDDNMHVTRQDLQSLHGLERIWFDLGATQQYYPLLHSAFWLEHRLWGDAVLGYHLTNVVLHAISACLLVLIVRRLAIPGAWLAGAIFAVHPVCVEAVAWISEQKSTLSGVFYLAAALTYLYFDRSRRRSTYFLATGLFLLALMSKSVTATLPAALLVVLWWQRGRIDWKRDLLPLLPWIGVGAAAGLFTAWVEATPRFIGAQGTQYALSLGQRILLAGRAPWFYASKALWPWNLMFIYPHWTIDSTQWWQWLFPLGTAAVAVVFVILSRKQRGPLAAFLIFTGTLFPVLGFLNVYPFRYSYVADHFQYLAILYLIVPVAFWITVLTQRISPGFTGTVFAVPLLALLAFATWQQSGFYRDYITLFRETIVRNPGSSFLHNNLGVELMREPDRLGEALVEFQAAVRLDPDSPDFHNDLGFALAQMPDRQPEAIAEYQTALRIDPHFRLAHLNLGLALASMPGRLQDAIAEYKTAIASFQRTLQGDPGFWEGHLNLGIAYAQVPGQESAAIAEYQTALRMKPDSALAHFCLGNVFHKMGRIREATEEYRAALALDPNYAEAHYELAYALAQIPGRVPEAIAECQKMLQLRPDDQPGRELLASLLAFRDRPQE
jgi:protein O-mannosyl-transferase